MGTDRRIIHLRAPGNEHGPASRGGITICELFVDGELVAIGVAACSPKDNYDKAWGGALATDRCSLVLEGNSHPLASIIHTERGRTIGGRWGAALHILRGLERVSWYMPAQGFIHRSPSGWSSPHWNTVRQALGGED